MKTSIKKWLAGSITGLFVSGILINAFWDFIKSYTGPVMLILLKIANLGILKLNDNIYKDIAHGLHENTSLEVFIMINFVFWYVAIIAVVISRKLIKRLTLVDTERDEKKNLSLFLKEKFFVFVIFPSAILFTTIVGFDIVREIYINKAIMYYEQLVVITRPDLTEEEYYIVNSNFAQINNSQDYHNVIDQLEEKAKSKKYKLPIKPSLL